MSEPITRADLRRLAKMIDETEGDREKWPISDLVEAVFERSAPPPRVPGASAQPGREGVESGPDQPTFDHDRDCAVFKGNNACDCGADQHSERWIREAAAEITRLREQVCALEHEAANVANRRVELEDSVRLAERRAGIEAAACEVDRLSDEEGLEPHHFAAAIRALADKPAPDQSKGG